MEQFKNFIARRRPQSGPASPSGGTEELSAIVRNAAEASAQHAARPSAHDADQDPENAPQRPAHNSFYHHPMPPRKPLNELRATPRDPVPASPPAPEKPDVAQSAQAPKRRIWDLDPTPDTPADTAADADPGPKPAAEAPAAPPVPARPRRALPQSIATPAATQAPAANPGRAKTRLLGFHAEDLGNDAFSAPKAPAATAETRFPIGWLVVVDGPGRGASFALTAGLSTIGRGTDQTVPLDFGDMSISRDNHASVAYDEEANVVFIGHGGKSNVVRLNGKPLLSNEELQQGDTIRIGKTTLRYVALCGGDFAWTGTDSEEPSHDDE